MSSSFGGSGGNDKMVLLSGWLIYFKKLTFLEVQSLACKMWQHYGLSDVLMNEKFFFIFKFGSMLDKEQCLEDGPWMFHNRLSFLQIWQPTMVLNKESPRFVPLWIKIFDVPLEFWSSEGLSYIASAVGKPLGMGKVTVDMCQLGVGLIAFARVLVEVKVRGDFSVGAYGKKTRVLLCGD